MAGNRKLAQRIAELPGIVVSDSMFGHGDAYWANGKEIAHFEGDGVIEVRLTRAVIKDRRAALKADPRVTLRPSGADWMEVTFATPADEAFVIELVATAEAAHRAPPGTMTKPPPTGRDLARRRRFH